METTTIETSHTPRRAAVNGLAIAGFVALILIGIATAIYAATFIPKTLSGLAGANVYLSSLTQPSQTPDQTTNQGSTPNIPISATPSYATTTAPAPAPVTTQPATPTYTAPAPTYTAPVYTTVQVPVQQTYYGLPDLVTTITSVGYLRTYGSTNSFVASSYVPQGYEGAVRFAIANRGTNVSGIWDFQALLPTTDNTSRYNSARQNSLRPGDSVVFTLGFDNVDDGNGSVRVTADQGQDINESNESNNTDSETISLNGNGNGSNNGNSSYDSNGRYCQYGTYYQNGRYYCDTSNSNSNNSSSYDSNGNYCSYGTYYQNNRYYCSSSNNSSNSNNSCVSGGYYGADGQYYCNGSSNDDNYYYNRTNACTNGSYYQNGSYYCY